MEDMGDSCEKHGTKWLVWKQYAMLEYRVRKIYPELQGFSLETKVLLHSSSDMF